MLLLGVFPDLEAVDALDFGLVLGLALDLLLDESLWDFGFDTCLLPVLIFALLVELDVKAVLLMALDLHFDVICDTLVIGFRDALLLVTIVVRISNEFECVGVHGSGSSSGSETV